jgi:hypothetical protein
VNNYINQINGVSQMDCWTTIYICCDVGNVITVCISISNSIDALGCAALIAYRINTYNCSKLYDTADNNYQVTVVMVVMMMMITLHTLTVIVIVVVQMKRCII